MSNNYTFTIGRQIINTSLHLCAMGLSVTQKEILMTKWSTTTTTTSISSSSSCSSSSSSGGVNFIPNRKQKMKDRIHE